MVCENYDASDCMTMVSIYFTFVYIVICYLSSAIFLASHGNFKLNEMKTIYKDSSGNIVTPSTDISGTPVKSEQERLYNIPRSVFNQIVTIIGIFNIVLLICFVMIIYYVYKS